MAVPLARHLTRFTSEMPVGLLAPASELEEPQVTLAVVDLEARLQAASSRALSEARAASDQLVAQIRSDHQREIGNALEAARADWVATQATTLNASCGAAVDVLRDLLCSRLAEILRPLLAEAVVARAVSSLSEAVDRLVADPTRPVLTVRGPGDLIAALRAARGEALSITYEDAATIEIKVTAEGAHVETKLDAALAMLRAPEAAEIAA